MTASRLSRKPTSANLKKFNIPTLIVHGDDDQIVPIEAAGRAAKMVKNAKLIEYAGAPTV
jgi:non-heme chloroperoxidase